MKRAVTVMLLIVASIVLVLVVTRPRGLDPESLPLHDPDVNNGQYVFHTGGCGSCHTSVPGGTEETHLGGGLTMETPFGLFRVPNISPHSSSGIGDWTTLDFVNAMRFGTSPDRRHYYPAFPYASYTRISIVDLMDLKAYLDTLPPVDLSSADHSLKFPWNIRAGIGLWKLVNLDSAFITPDSRDSDRVERGRYLVEGAGHCGECHTARNWTGGIDLSRWLAGAPNPEGEGQVPNITPHENG